ncbi:MAG: NAD(P)-dependent oxidoreductase [Firmicutes bacterium]|nr:NAD(P)-dependent oxidoreductase [Alicyclobacillaceae bacterium]MCL6498316.1 NAD(P)-dependent oxidoreductase [Bacillota bacterium]
MILITGGMGFIGLNTAQALLDRGQEVVLGRHRSRHIPDFLAAAIGRTAHEVALDVADPDSIRAALSTYPVDGIVHLAFSAWANAAPRAEWHAYVDGLRHLLDAAAEAGVRRVVFASSVDVYRGWETGPLKEEAPLYPRWDSPIGLFKHAGELLGGYYAQRIGVEFVSLRLAVIYGPLYHSLQNVVGQVCHAIARGERRWRPRQSGAMPAWQRPANDFCYVKDCADGIARAALAPHLAYPVYNIGSGTASTVLDVLHAGQALGLDPDPEWVATLATTGPYADRSLALGRAREDLGYAPRFSLSSGMADYVEWLRHHPE